MTTEEKRELDVLEAEESVAQKASNELERELCKAKQEVLKARHKAVKIVFGAEPGSRVMVEGKEAEVSRISNFLGTVKKIRAGEKPWLKVRYIKKDGTVSKNELTIHQPWTLKTP